MATGMFDNPFNYSLESDKLKRRQQIADLLRQQNTGVGDPRFIQNSVGTFYAGGNSIGSSLAKLGGRYLASKKDKKIESDRTDLDARDTSMREAALKILQNNEPPEEGAPGYTDPETGEEVLQEVIVTGGPSKAQALALLRGGSAQTQQYANDYEDKKGLFAPPAAPNTEFHDGYLINMDTGENKRVTPETPVERKTEVVEAKGRKLLVDSQTGETIRDLGFAGDGGAGAASKAQEASVAAKSTFEMADAEIQGTIDTLRGVLEKKGGGSIEDTAGGGGVGDLIGRGLGWAFGTDGDATRFNVEQVLSQKIVGSLKQLKAAGVGTAAFNSDKEAERIEKAFGRINWKDEAEARRQLNNIYTDLLDTQGRARKAHAEQQKALGGVAPSGGISLGDF